MKRKGFTLIELLVVIFIIGLLSTLAVVALNSTRQTARDAIRVSDINQIRSALELYFNDQQSYPAGSGVLGAANFACLAAVGWTTADCTNAYMKSVPANQKPNGVDYVYTSDGSNGSYTITFSLEGQAGGLSSGTHTATPDGIQ